MDNYRDLFVQSISETEQIAEEILRDKAEIIALDRNSNKIREAIRALDEVDKKESSNGKTWMAMGSMFIKFPTPKAKELLRRDHSEINLEINSLRKELMPKVNKLRDSEWKPEISAFDLQPLSKEEFSAMSQVIYRNS